MLLLLFKLSSTFRISSEDSTLPRKWSLKLISKLYPYYLSLVPITPITSENSSNAHSFGSVSLVTDLCIISLSIFAHISNLSATTMRSPGTISLTFGALSPLKDLTWLATTFSQRWVYFPNGSTRPPSLTYPWLPCPPAFVSDKAQVEYNPSLPLGKNMCMWGC